MDESVNKKDKLIAQLLEQYNKAKSGKENPNKDQPNLYQKMGLPEEWNKSGMVFVRTFRWTLDAPNHPDVGAWVQKIQINYKKKTIELEAFEETKGITHEWIQDLINDSASREFTIKHYDGCGCILFTTTYSGVEVVDHQVGYNYESSDILTQKLWLTYKHIRRSKDLRLN